VSPDRASAIDNARFCTDRRLVSDIILGAYARRARLYETVRLIAADIESLPRFIPQLSQFVDSLSLSRTREPAFVLFVHDSGRQSRRESGDSRMRRMSELYSPVRLHVRTFIARLTPIRVDHARRMRGIIIVALYLLNH